MKSHYIIAGFILIMFASAIAYILDKKDPDQSPLAEFAQCLNEKQAVFYGSATCSHCIQQKRDFGSAYKFLNYKECNPHYGSEQDVAQCEAVQVPATPYWVISPEGKEPLKLRGRQTLQTLAQATGCSLPSQELEQESLGTSSSTTTQ